MTSPSATTSSPKFPSYESRKEACSRLEVPDSDRPPRISPSVTRLRWSLNGALTTSISVMAHHWISPTMPPDEPYYQPVPSDGTAGSGKWHPVSQDALMEPKISSIAITVADLVNWESNWLEAHAGHYCSDLVPLVGFDPTLTRIADIGPLPDADPDDPDDDWSEFDGLETGRLLMCCGVERPRKTLSDPRFKIVVEAKGEAGFLTVHDYVEQVHSWLMGLREEILEATGVMRELQGELPFSAEEKLMVRAYGASASVMDENRWTFNHRQPYEGCP